MTDARPLCADHAADGIWIGADMPIRCVAISRCLSLGCYWRKFHQLAADKYRRKPEPQQSLDLAHV